MYRSAKYCEGVRARHMINQVLEHDKLQNERSNASESRSSRVVAPEKTDCALLSTKVSMIREKVRSLSVSNVHKEVDPVFPSRCSSVPPVTNMMRYESLHSSYIFCNDLPCTDKGLSLSMSALTYDNSESKNEITRSKSVPPSCCYVIPQDYNNPEFSNTIDCDSDDGDYSGADSDKTYCPSSECSQSSTSNSSSVPVDRPSTSSGIYHGDINEGRKRHRKSDPDNWKKNRNKKLRMHGEEYLGFTKPKNRKLKQDKIRPARVLGDKCNSEFCRKSCSRNCEKFSDERRLEIHNNFWKQLNWDQRKVYVVGLVSRKGTVRKTIDHESRRGVTFDYFLPLDENKKVQVCRTTFLSTLSLGSFTVQTWAKTANSIGTIPCQDVLNLSRIKTPQPRTTRKITTAQNFLDNIPKLPSHYGRKDSAKLYLEPMYRSLSDLYSKYKEYCIQNEEPVLCRFTFEKIFKEKNLSLYTLKKDMCDVCVGHKTGNVSDSIYHEHIRRKNRARKEKEADKQEATSGEFILLSMDLEAVKMCPYLTASALYFKTKLTCHNFTVYDLVTHEASCYWFDETSADLSANTFVSFLCDYLERYCLPRGKAIVIYSDGCTYQNRNKVMANALLNFSIQHNVIIIQKYLEPGHTQMECDSVHSAIERKLKNREIHLPSDYITVTKEARKSPSPYEAIQIDYSFVKDYAEKSTWRYNSIRPGRRPGDPVVVNLRAIQYTPEGVIKYKLDFDEDWKDMPIRPKKFRSNSVVYSSLHAAPIPISFSKFDHLQQLKEVLPKDCHNFYDMLPHD